MRFINYLLISLCVAVVVQAVAAEPPVPSGTSAPSAQPSPAAAPASAPGNPPPAAGSAPAAASTTAPNTAKTDAASATDATAAQAKFLREGGYKPEVKNGQTLYCRKEAQLGSRFEAKVCATAAEVERLAARSQEAIEKVQREKGSLTGK